MGLRNALNKNVRRVTHPEEQTEAQRKRALKLAIAVIGGLAVIALAVGLGRLWLAPHNDEAGPVAVQTSGAPAVQPTGGATGDPNGGCQLDNTEKDISKTPPVAKQWVLMGATAIPELDGAGPCNTLDSGLKTGYAHTMTGALLAAHIYSWSVDISAPTKQTPERITEAIIPGDLRNALSAKVKAILAGDRPRGDTSKDSSIQLVGYKIGSYTQTDAQLELLYTSTIPDLAGQLISAPVHLIWADNDWKIVPLSTEQWGSAGQASSKAGYTQWGPNQVGQQ